MHSIKKLPNSSLYQHFFKAVYYAFFPKWYIRTVCPLPTGKYKICLYARIIHICSLQELFLNAFFYSAFQVKRANEIRLFSLISLLIASYKADDAHCLIFLPGFDFRMGFAVADYSLSNGTHWSILLNATISQSYEKFPWDCLFSPMSMAPASLYPN